MGQGRELEEGRSPVEPMISESVSPNETLPLRDPGKSKGMHAGGLTLSCVTVTYEMY